MIIFAMLFVQGLMNMYAFWLIPWIELLAGIGHVCLFIVFVVVLVTMGPRHSAHYIFLEQSTSSGWTDTFVSWNLGMLTCAWSFTGKANFPESSPLRKLTSYTGFDGALHMSEEVRKAKQAVPRALFWTIALNGVLAYAMVIVILTTMGSIDDALSSAFPIIVIVQEVTGSLKATTALVTGLYIISFAVTLASIASVSRLTWAWSRDGGLPAWFSVVRIHFLHSHHNVHEITKPSLQVSPKHHVPERAVWLACVVVGLLALLNVGSTAAFGAIIALSSLALYFSYLIAISCMLYSRYQSDPVKLGGWNLGRYGPYINIFALIYTVWIMIFLPFPQTLPVSGVNMNYCGPIFVAVFLFAVALWFLRARKHWPGPNVEIVKYVIAQE
jgi:choline transport protein